MNKLYLIRKTEIDLINNYDNFHITIKYLKNKLPLNSQKQLTVIENVGKEKYREAYLKILELVNIEENINKLDLQFNNYNDNILKLVFAIIILFSASIFFLNAVFNFLTIMNIASFWKIISVILIGFINFQLALQKYNDIRYKNDEFNNYKNRRNALARDFENKYEKVLEKIGWFELQSDYLLESTTAYYNCDKNLNLNLQLNRVDDSEILDKNNLSDKQKILVKKHKKR